MSHFSCIVITPNKPTQEELAKILQPWHEYECTGVEDEYVIEVETPIEEILEQFNKPQEVVVLDPKQENLVVLSRYDDVFYTKESEDRLDRITKRKEFELPEGAEIREMPADEARKFGIGYATVAEAANEYFGADIEHDGKFFRLTNPNKKWDWWQVGGRWTGMLIPHYEPGTDPRNKEPCDICGGTGIRLVWPKTESFIDKIALSTLIRKGTKYDQNEEIHQQLKCNACDGVGIRAKWPTDWAKIEGDQMMLDDIPLITLQNEAEEKVLKRYDAAHAIIAGRSFMNWKETMEQYPKIEEAREAYRNQPVIRELTEAKILDFFDEVDEFRLTREQLASERRAEVICPFAYIKDGKWFQRGEMGWWACVSDEQDKKSWAQEFNDMLNQLPRDYYLSVIDCHI